MFPLAVSLNLFLSNLLVSGDATCAHIEFLESNWPEKEKNTLHMPLSPISKPSACTGEWWKPHTWTSRTLSASEDIPSADYRISKICSATSISSIRWSVIWTLEDNEHLLRFWNRDDRFSKASEPIKITGNVKERPSALWDLRSQRARWPSPLQPLPTSYPTWITSLHRNPTHAKHVIFSHIIFSDSWKIQLVALK